MEIKFVIIGWSITILLLIVTIVVGIMLIAKLRKQNAMLKDDVIGMIAGAIPAYRASRLNPVDALRSE